MDCNKDEAIKAMEIAEKKMQNKDFAGGKKFAYKAQQLYGDLDGISQMLTVCDVHCSAEQKVLDTEMDWYGILKVDLTADEASIKKQYRKLALLLHPDKNKLEGAEAAFKLIGEAHRVLSDQPKRSLYDMKYKAFKERSKFPQQRQNFSVQRQPGACNSFGNINRPQFTSVNLHREQSQPGLDRPTFWTACPFCNMRYQYYRDILNRALRCQNCMKPFIAYDSNVQGVPSGANCTRPTVPQQKEVSQDGSKMGPQSTVRDFPSNVGHRRNYERGTEPSESKAGTSNGRSKHMAGEDAVKVEERMENQRRPKFNAETRNVGSKRRKSEVESSESCDSESSDEFEISEDMEGGVHVEQNTGRNTRNTRRSSRQKRQVTYNEDSDDDFVGNRKDNRSSTSIKKEDSTTRKPDGFAADVKKEEELKKQKKCAPFEESSCNGNPQAEYSDRNGKEASAVKDSDESPDIDETFDSEFGRNTMPGPELIEVADPDFYVFDNDRKEDCFEIDQTWAVYDNMDGMPRFYARIKKVYSPEFKVRFTWLEPDPDDQDDIEWVNEDLPVSCGKYKHGKIETTEDINMFSHSVVIAKGIRRGSIVIYPQKGETWALFKDWNINWNSDPDNHRNYEFDFVEIISEFEEGSGLKVAYLEKVVGFVSLFRPKKGVASFQIPPNELYRFSHMVPSYRTTGKERDDVPEGSFELDTASLPANLVTPKVA